MTPLMNFIVYFISINMITLILFWFDKRAKVLHKRRLPERLLLFVIAAGGTLAAKRAMGFYNLKARKSSFRTQMGLIMFLQFALILFIIYLQIPPEMIDETIKKLRLSTSL